MAYIVVLIIYLALLAGIGLLTSRKLKNVEDFYIGGRKIGPWVTAFSFIAAYFSSVVIVGGGGFGYKFGMATVWVGAINVLLGCTLCWIVLGERIRRFTKKLGSMTIPDFLGQRFDSKEIRLIPAFVIVIFMIVYNVSVLKGMGHMFEILMGMPYFWGIFLSGAIILFYSAIGGYLAVVWTSFIQAWIMIFGVLLLTFATLNKIGGFTIAHLSLQEISAELVSTPGVWGWSGLISYALIVSFGVWGMPQLLIRFCSIKNEKAIRVGTVIASIGGCMAILPYFAGAVARVLCPNLPSPDHAIPELAKLVLHPIGGAIFFAGVIAAGMSTFASVLIIISSSVVRDIYQKGLQKNIPESDVLKKSKIWSVVVGLISLLIAIKPPGLVLVLCAFAWGVIASTCLWPLFFGLYWKGTTRAGVLSSMIGGCSVSIIWMVLKKPYGIHGFIPGIIISLILIVVVSKFTQKLPEEQIHKLWD